jgi:nucleotide-binding universal stress UspA family protein
MQTILVPTQNIAGMTSALETALLLAQRMGAYIEGFALRFGIPQFIVAELSSGIPMESYQAHRDEEIAEARRIFETFMKAHDIPSSRGAADRPSCGWLEDAPEGESFVGSHGRAFDVTVMSRPDADTLSLHNRAIESGLFEGGRPVLLSPPVAPKQIATSVMIHWNGSTEQARTNAFAMPILRKAERVMLLTVVGGQEVPGPSVNQVLRQLQYNGIPAKTMGVELDGRSTGEAVLAAAKAEDCDLLVKGAFTRHRLRQMIFGGATSHIMEHAELPVLMAH